jgi:uncharacterized protein
MFIPRSHEDHPRSGEVGMDCAGARPGFPRCAEGFAGLRFTFEDTRFDYPERRYVTVGLLDGRMVILVWTPGKQIEGEECRRMISMRNANAREQARYLQRLGEG